jgi:predicted TIM-barrel fold metal-dependent hydrolase
VELAPGALIDSHVHLWDLERCMPGSDWPVLNGRATETYDSRRRSAQLKEW